VGIGTSELSSFDERWGEAYPNPFASWERELCCHQIARLHCWENKSCPHSISQDFKMVAPVDTMKLETRLFINNEFVKSESGKQVSLHSLGERISNSDGGK
jgi:hypothetical protein